MQRILEYLYIHQDQRISLDKLAKVAGYSPFYFQRLVKQQIGIGPGKLNELIRLQRGTYLLTYRQWLTITDIAFECGYQSSDSFSRAFKRTTGYSPSQFKTLLPAITAPLQPYLQQLDQDVHTMSSTTDSHSQIEIKSLPALEVCALQHTGNPAKLNSSIQRFIAWRRENKLPPASYRTFNFLHNDPITVAPEAFCFDLACERPAKFIELDEGMRFDTIPAGRYAMLTVVGGDNALASAVNYLTTDFLAENNEQAADFPVIVERVTFYPEVPYHQAKSHISLLLCK